MFPNSFLKIIMSCFIIILLFLLFRPLHRSYTMLVVHLMVVGSISTKGNVRQCVCLFEMHYLKIQRKMENGESNLTHVK